MRTIIYLNNIFLSLLVLGITCMVVLLCSLFVKIFTLGMFRVDFNHKFLRNFMEDQDELLRYLRGGKVMEHRRG